ncbi:DUF1015 family protein [Anaeromicrobium sediminis]|nr:DUF1015 family protein [Anaeromicrobium sediminis]
MINKNLDNMMDKKILVQNTKPSLYLYRQVMSNRVQISIVTCTSIKE